MSIEKKVFTPEEIKALEKFQNDRSVHPFTCCGPSDILECERNKGISEGILTPTENGWICPCGKYTQNWAHSFMKEKEE